MRLAFLALAALSVSCLAARADTVYTYTGPDFTSASGSFTTSDSVTGSLTFASPLAPDLIDAGVVPASFTFSDDVDTLSSPAATLTFGDVELSTDANGNITQFAFQVNQYDSTGTVLEAQIFITSYGSLTEVYDLTKGGAAVSATGSFAPGVATTPEPSSLALLGTGLLGITGIIRKRFA